MRWSTPVPPRSRDSWCPSWISGISRITKLSLLFVPLSTGGITSQSRGSLRHWPRESAQAGRTVTIPMWRVVKKGRMRLQCPVTCGQKRPRNIEPMMVQWNQCWFNVACRLRRQPTLNHHWFNVSCLLGTTTIPMWRAVKTGRAATMPCASCLEFLSVTAKWESIIWTCRSNDGPPSATAGPTPVHLLPVAGPANYIPGW